MAYKGKNFEHKLQFGIGRSFEGLQLEPDGALQPLPMGALFFAMYMCASLTSAPSDHDPSDADIDFHDAREVYGMHLQRSVAEGLYDLDDWRLQRGLPVLRPLPPCGGRRRKRAAHAQKARKAVAAAATAAVPAAAAPTPPPKLLPPPWPRRRRRWRERWHSRCRCRCSRRGAPTGDVQRAQYAKLADALPELLLPKVADAHEKVAMIARRLGSGSGGGGGSSVVRADYSTVECRG